MKKRTVGRPKITNKRVKFTTTLPQRTVDRLREIGNGNAAAAIVELVERVK
ncbi:MAG: hypothetical protein ACREVO_10200 [Steroidobacteraceae bacterium]